MRQKIPVSDADFARIRHLLPDVEPELGIAPSGPRKGGRYWVAETRLDGNERRYLNECIDTNWVSSRGPFVERFEQAFAEEAGCRYGVSCANGTVALHLVLAALGVGPGDEVVVPTYTMIATANAARYTGADVVLVDAEAQTFNLDPARLASAITPRTKAVIVTHIYGHPAAMSPLRAICAARGIPLIEDAAEAHGAELDGQRAGGLGLAGTFSFYANKLVTTGEGGMVTTNDAELAALMGRLRDHAFSPDRHFWHEYLGFNYRMSNLQAAVGLAQTERLADIVAARRRLRSWYDEGLAGLPFIAVPREAPGARNVFWMYGIHLMEGAPVGRDAMRSALAARGIETRSFFIPIHLQPIYLADFRGQEFPVADELCRTGLYLPTSQTLTEDDAAWIAGEIAAICREAVAR